MPVHHEKIERPKRQEEPTTREYSRTRSKQREISIERKPIISQDKPNTKPKEKAESRTDRRTTGPSGSSNVNKKPTTRQTTIKTDAGKQVVTKHRISQPTKPMVTKRKDGPTSQVKKVEATSSKTQDRTKRLSDRSTSKILATTDKRPREKILPDSKIKRSSRESQKPKEREAVPSNRHDRTRTRTLSPSEVKVLPQKPVKDNMEIFGAKHEDVPSLHDSNAYSSYEKKEEKQEDEEAEKEEDEDEDEEEEEEGEDDEDYDDDFEDYESDFEEDSGTGEEENNSEPLPRPEEEKPQVMGSAKTSARKRIILTSAEERERKLDSGSYHVSSVPHKEEIEQIKMAIQSENQISKQWTVKEPDEGYQEEVKIKHVSSEGPQVIDFTQAGKRHKEKENLNKAKRRGEQLLQMITLDTITYNLLDIPAIPYDEFMANYGQSNTSQSYAQTNEDDNEEEVQTEEIETVNKWTQAPATFSKRDSENGIYSFSKEERMGVGSEGGPTDEESEEYNFLRVSQSRIETFIGTAAQRVLMWLEMRDHNYSASALSKSEIPCCEGMMVLNRTEETSGEKRQPVTVLSTSYHPFVLSVEKTQYSESILKIWTVLTPSSALKILVCHQEVTCACFGSGRGDLVFAGASDGSLNLWDLRESASLHITSDSSLHRSPTYSTAEILKTDGHMSNIVSILVLRKDQDSGDEDFRPIQVASLDQTGEVIIWSVVQQNLGIRAVPNTDLGLAPWGRLRLVRSSNFQASNILSENSTSLKMTDRFTAMTSRGSTGHELLIASSSNKIIHCSVDGSPLKPKFYLPSKNSRPAAVTTISVYTPDERYFLAGCNDGTIRLHGRNQEEPLINLHWNLGDTSPTSSVHALNWIANRPCMFFALDYKARLHVWDLTVSDIYPQFTFPAATNALTSAAVLLHKNFKQAGSLMLGRQNGAVEIHRIKADSDKRKSEEQWKKESKMFQRYVRIL